MTHDKHLRISLVGKGAQSLLASLDASGLGYSRVSPPAGRIMASGEMILLSLGVLTHVSRVLVEWLRARPTRKLNITTKDGMVVMIEADSAGEVERMLKAAEVVGVFDTGKPCNGDDQGERPNSHGSQGPQNGLQ